MTKKIWVISDIHGCYDQMMALYKHLLESGLNPKKDIVIFLGDYIDRGKDGKKVIEKLIEWSIQYPHWVFLKGNHEDIFYDWKILSGRIYGIHNWFANGGKTTYESYGGHFGKIVNNEFEAPKYPDFPEEHLKFLFSLPIYYETDDYFFVHAGLPDNLLDEAKLDYNGMMWLRDSFIKSKYNWGKKIIFGHTCDDSGEYYNLNNSWGKNQSFMPIVKQNKIGIDCAVCPPSAKRLSCLELPEEKFHFIESGSLKYWNG
jgi:serine/threonine protein phosphatase 1